MIIAQASSRTRSLKTRKFSSQVTQPEWKFEHFSWLKNFWGESRCKRKSVKNGSENKCFSLNWIPSRFTWTASEIEYFFNEKNKRLQHKEAFVWCLKWIGNTSKLENNRKSKNFTCRLDIIVLLSISSSRHWQDTFYWFRYSFNVFIQSWGILACHSTFVSFLSLSLLNSSCFIVIE